MKTKCAYLCAFLAFYALFFLTCCFSFSYAQGAPEAEIAGKLFGVEVPLTNYYFAKRAVIY